MVKLGQVFGTEEKEGEEGGGGRVSKETLLSRRRDEGRGERKRCDGKKVEVEVCFVDRENMAVPVDEGRVIVYNDAATKQLRVSSALDKNPTEGVQPLMMRSLPNMRGPGGHERYGNVSGDGARMRSPSTRRGIGGKGLRRGLEQDKAAQEAKFRQIQEQIQRDTQRALQEKAKKREAAFNEMFKKVSAGLNGTDPLIRKIDNTIEYTETMRHKKKVMLYDEWRECVFDRIHHQLQRKLSERTSRSIENRLRARYDDFISTSNKKGAVFRDIITEKEYNPMAVRSDVIRFDSTIDDPVKRDIRRTTMEKRQAAELGVDGAGADLVETNAFDTRDILDLELWDKLDITPYGRFSEELRARSKLQNSERHITRSSIDLDQYRLPSIVDDAHASGSQSFAHTISGSSRRLVTHPGGESGAKMNAAIYHRDVRHDTSEGCSGDSWLGNQLIDPAKGRKRAPESLHHLNLDKARTNDAWLGNILVDPTAGRRSLPAPGGDRGRKDLFSLICQRGVKDKLNSQLILDGETAGDAWLEARGKRRVVPSGSTSQTDNLNFTDCMRTL